MTVTDMYFWSSLRRSRFRNTQSHVDNGEFVEIHPILRTSDINDECTVNSLMQRSCTTDSAISNILPVAKLIILILQ